MAVEVSGLAEAPSWEAQALRVSLFVPSTVQATEKMWTVMMGAPPETEERRPREITTTRFTGVLQTIHQSSERGIDEMLMRKASQHR
jgi:hypothetical protein